MYRLFSKKIVRGVSLIEAVVTLGVVMLLITGLVVGITSSLQNAQTSKSRALAVQYGQDAIEVLRQKRDTDWTAFALYGTVNVPITYCLNELKNLVAPSAEGTCPGTFQRILIITKTLINPGPSQKEVMDVQVDVSWLEGSSRRSITLRTKFTPWK